MQPFLVNIGVLEHLQAHIVEAFKRTHTGSTHSYSLTIVGQQFFYGLSPHGNILRMHGVFTNRSTLDRLERSGTYM